MISVWEDCHSLLNFGKKEEVWGILTGQEVAILGADQKERGLWGQECGLPSPRREERGLLSRTAAGNRAYHDLDTRRSTVAQKGHTCKFKMLLQIKKSTCKLKRVHAN